MKNKSTIFCTVLLFSVALAWSLLARPVRSTLGGSSVEGIPAEDYTIADYIQDGLIAMWDGEFNAIDSDGAWYHDPDATVWMDLVGDADLTVFKPWSDNALVGDGVSRMAHTSQSSQFLMFQTVEACFKTESEDFQFVYIDVGRRTCIGCYGTSVGVGLRQARLLDSSSLDRNLTISTIYAGTSTSDNTSVFACANGVPLTKTGSGNWSAPLAWNSVTIGSAYRATTSCFKGQVFCVRMYSRALSESEIHHNYLVDQARFGL